MQSSRHTQTETERLDEYVDRWSSGRYYSLEYNHRDELCVVGNLDVYDREYDPIEVMPEIVLELLRIGLAYAGLLPRRLALLRPVWAAGL